MFEAKSYNQVRKCIGYANCIFVFLILILGFEFILLDAQVEAINKAIQHFINEPLLALFPSAIIASVVWAYFTTVILRIHDRLYEPILVKWRASYDADFILRSICREYQDKLPEDFFNDLYFSKHKRDTAMYRLFYSFVGDSKKDHEELLERFYTIIRNYWIIGLAEFYAIFALLIYAIYAVVEHIKLPSILMLILLLVAIVCRIINIRVLDQARPVTKEQVQVILSKHSSEIKEAIENMIMSR
jgi:hypothetical protein